MNRFILLVEPSYRSKFPPLGLMKIAQYHKEKGDYVEFVKGLSSSHRDRWRWDRIYIASLFTYDWAHTIKALRYYGESVKEPIADNLVVGGVLATLMPDDIRQTVKCRVVSGLLDTKGKLGYDDDDIVETMLPDYGILNDIAYCYPASNAYIAYATRGCIRRCSFCAVPQIEPLYKDYLSLKDQVERVTELYGPKKDLLLLDNNVLASDRLFEIISDIKSLGFPKNAVFRYRSKGDRVIHAQRHVDFNQGIDIRLLTDISMGYLSEIALKPLRLAFDNISYRKLYEEKIRLAAKHGFVYLSNYLLFNYDDQPEHLYERMRMNVELNEELGLQIYSFPMRYINLMSKNRLVTTPGNIGKYWDRKSLRAIQCVLLRTKGVVGTRLSYFEEAFGQDIKEFNKILMMPEYYIINRKRCRLEGRIDLWWQNYSDLTTNEKQMVDHLISNNTFHGISDCELSPSIRRVLQHYNPLS